MVETRVGQRKENPTFLKEVETKKKNGIEKDCEVCGVDGDGGGVSDGDRWDPLRADIYALEASVVVDKEGSEPRIPSANGALEDKEEEPENGEVEWENGDEDENIEKTTKDEENVVEEEGGSDEETEGEAGASDEENENEEEGVKDANNEDE